jgi:hypothetical protein
VKKLILLLAVALCACAESYRPPIPMGDGGVCAPPLEACTLDTPCCNNGAAIGEQTCLNSSATEGTCAVNCLRDRDCPRGQQCDLGFMTDVIPHGVCR